jgi:putative DNA primase/helicase
LTILKWHLTANRSKPAMAIPLPSFEAWSRIIRDALLALDQPDPVVTMRYAREADPERSTHVSLIAALRASFGVDVEFTVSEVMARAFADHNPEDRLRDALRTINVQPSVRVIGRELHKFQGRISDGHCLRVRLIHGVSAYRIVRVEGGGANGEGQGTFDLGGKS